MYPLSAFFLDKPTLTHVFWRLVPKRPGPVKSTPATIKVVDIEIAGKNGDVPQVEIGQQLAEEDCQCVWLFPGGASRGPQALLLGPFTTTLSDQAGQHRQAKGIDLISVAKKVGFANRGDLDELLPDRVCDRLPGKRRDHIAKLEPVSPGSQIFDGSYRVCTAVVVQRKGKTRLDDVKQKVVGRETGGRHQQDQLSAKHRECIGRQPTANRQFPEHRGFSTILWPCPALYQCSDRRRC